MSRRKPRRQTAPAKNDSASSGERLQKVLAAAGIGSRRECEELIVTGRVEVDGEEVTELGTRVDPLHQEIRVDGTQLSRPKRAYFVLNKPPGVVCTNNDPSGRVLAVDLVRSSERLFTVGRLDRTSEGLILITNDGELANRLTHPKYGVEKRYLVRVVGSPSPAICAKLLKGIYIAEGMARVSDIRVRKRTSKFSDLEISLREGRNREIRRVLARVGHKVVKLKRIAIGPLRLGELPLGSSRQLTHDELKKLTEIGPPVRKSRPAKRPDSKRPDSKRPDSKRPDSKPPRDRLEQKKFTEPPLPFDDPDEVEVIESRDDKVRGTVLSFEDVPTTPAATSRRGRPS